MTGFSICECYKTFWICQNMPWQSYGYISVFNILAFWIWKCSEYARVTQSSKYTTILLNIFEWDVNMPEYVWIYNNRHDFEYASYKIWLEVILQVNKFSLKDECIQNPVNDLRHLWLLTIFSKHFIINLWDDYKYVSGSKYVRVLNISGLSICHSFEFPVLPRVYLFL